MLVFPTVRLITSLLSWALLALALYLLWTWANGSEVLTTDGVVTVRDEWRGWLALALLAWGVLGRYPTLMLLTRRDVAPLLAIRSHGEQITGATGSNLYVETHGQGPTLILTHGWGLDSTVWHYAKARLSDQFRLVTWDLPGLGRSRLAHRRVDLRDMAEDLRGLIQASDQPVVLVGHSVGGMVLQTLARDYPEIVNQRVAGLVLLNTTYTNPLKTIIFAPLLTALQPVLTFGARLAAMLEPIVWLSAWQAYFSGAAHVANRLGFGRHVTRSQLEHVTRLTVRNRPGVQAKGNIAMFHWDSADALACVTCPVLVIGDGADIITKLEASERMAQLAPQGKLAVVMGGNHLGFLEMSDRYLDCVAEFAERVTRVSDAPFRQTV